MIEELKEFNQENLRRQASLENQLNLELAEVISEMLKRNGISGDYIFNVRRNSDYCMEPIYSIRGEQLTIPIYCLGSGYTTVDNPKEIGRI